MGALYFYNRNLSRSLCLKNIKQVGHAFLSEMHFVIIDDETGNAHDIIFLFKVWIVLEIIDVGRYIFIIRGIRCAAATRSGHIVQERDTAIFT